MLMVTFQRGTSPYSPPIAEKCQFIQKCAVGELSNMKSCYFLICFR